MKEFLINLNRTKAIEDRSLVLIIYDIIDNRKRYHFAKFLSAYAKRVQKSCFESYMTDRELQDMMGQIDRRIDRKEDNVRIYQLTAHGKVFEFGKEVRVDFEKNLIL